MRRRHLLGAGLATLAGCLAAAPPDATQQHDDPSVVRPADLGDTWTEVGGRQYGAVPLDTGPIGGAGVRDVVTGGAFHVDDRSGLVAALEEASDGDAVYIDPEAEIDLTVPVYADGLVLHVPPGVTLASNRRAGASRGGLIYSDTFDTAPLIRAHEGSRITGLRLRGPDPERRMELHRDAFQGSDARGSRYYYAFPVSRGLEAIADEVTVDNCELWGWSHAAVSFERGAGHAVRHSYLHHNQRHGLGYGVALDRAEVDIAYNLFDWNRHAVAGTGRTPSGYAARHNVILANANGHLLDMHGGEDRGDGTNVAGTWMRFEHNTLANTRRRAIVIRGIPAEEAVVTRNWFYAPVVGRQAVAAVENASVDDNVYGEPPERREETYRY